MSPRSFLPCLPTRVKIPPSGPDWIHEIKLDGFRLMAQRSAVGIRLVTKQGSDFSDRYSQVVAALEKLKVKSIVIDGEVMCFTGADQDFDKLWARKHDHEARLCAFDLLELNGTDLRGLPLIERKARLFKIIRRSVGIEFVEHVTGEGPPPSTIAFLLRHCWPSIAVDDRIEKRFLVRRHLFSPALAIARVNPAMDH